MAKSPAGKRRLLLVLLIVAAGLVAARSVRREQSPPLPAAPRPKPEPVAAAPAPVVEPAAAPVAAEPVAPDPEPEPLVASVSLAEPEPDVDVLTEPTAADLAELSTDEPVQPAPVPTQPEQFAVSAEPPAAEPPAAEPTASGPAAGPFPGSVLPLGDGSAPSEEYVVKGNANSMRSHGPSSPYYGRTRAEVWFRTERDAVAAGFRPYASKGD